MYSQQEKQLFKRKCVFFKETIVCTEIRKGLTHYCLNKQTKIQQLTTQYMLNVWYIAKVKLRRSVYMYITNIQKKEMYKYIILNSIYQEVLFSQW